MRILSILAALVMPVSLWANCGGVDQRGLLNGAQKAEIATRLENVPFAAGNHWTATKGARTVHVIGTMHVDDPRMDALATRLAPVIQNADILLVEATKADQKQLERDMATKPELAFLTGKTLIDLMPADDWEALAAAASARGIPPFMAAKFQPWYLSLMLAISPCTLAKIAAGGEGLDARLMTLAADADVPTRSLEPHTTIFTLFANDPIEQQIELLTLGLLPEEISENATKTLTEQYFAEDHMSALETSRVITRPAIDMPDAEFDRLYDDFIDLLVDDRNKNWMPVIEQAEGARIVVAAGALHLGGEFGVLNMLAQRGYTLERQAF